MKIRLLKFIDFIFGVLLVACFPRPATRCPQKVTSILFIRPGGIGDAVLLIPTLKAALSTFPEVQIDVLAEKRNAEVFQLCPGIRAIYRYDKLGEFRDTLTSLYDVVVDTEQWHRLSALTARMIRSSLKIGFATNSRRRCFTHAVEYSQGDYEQDSFARLLEPLAPSLVVPRETPFISIAPEVCNSIEGVLPADDKRFRVAIFPGASIPERRWGANNFHQVAAALVELGGEVVLIGGEGDRDDAGQIAQGLPVLNLAGATSLQQSAAVLSSCHLLLGGDSGVLHLAVGLGVPTVSLFGSGIEAKWAPQEPQHSVINKRLSCSPCTRFGTTPSCPYGVACMKEISSHEVVDVVRQLLTKGI